MNEKQRFFKAAEQPDSYETSDLPESDQNPYVPVSIIQPDILHE